ncbi:hypothetical protein B0H13DRAFT_1878506 [Mycena leptocephala]|nr:hypothetical protein B0H13DRAFT_1878506 [Mycena leptocephala]
MDSKSIRVLPANRRVLFCECIRSEDNEIYKASRYSAFDIDQVLGLSREDFILIALLAGRDHLDGLPQCGVTLATYRSCAGWAWPAAHHRPFVGSIARGFHSLSAELTNTSSHLPHRYKRLTADIPTNFPDLEVINLYRYPIISGPEAATHLVFHLPHLGVLVWPYSAQYPKS